MAILADSELFLGCQGWTEADWQGSFYPPDLKAGNRLASYSTALKFVEIDSTFYSVPMPSTVRKWRTSTPERFRFAAKLPQAITHDPDPRTGFPRRPLDGAGWQEILERFVERMRLLEDKLLALVVQLPPQWHWRPDLLSVLSGFLQALPGDLRWAIEFRHRGWLNEEVLALLRDQQVALVIQDLYYMPRRVEVTTPELAYIRLQGRRKDIVKMDEIQIQRDEALDFWADAVRQLVEQGVKRVVVAANNHYQGFSPGTIAVLQQRLGLPISMPPARLFGQLPLG